MHTVARIIGRTGKTFMLDQPLPADRMVKRNARATTVFPVVSGCDIERAQIEGLVFDGNTITADEPIRDERKKSSSR